MGTPRRRSRVRRPQSNETVERIARTARSRRLELGMTQRELAETVGVSRSSVQALESGDPGVSLGITSAIAVGLNITLMATAPAVDLDRNAAVLADVLELAEHLPHDPKPELEFPALARRQ